MSRSLIVAASLALGTAPSLAATEHGAMDHGDVDHAAMGHAPPPRSPTAGTPAPAEPRTPIPVVTDADRAAALAPAGGHAMAPSVHAFLLVDRLEGWDAGDDAGGAAEVHGWIGTDLDRLWLRGAVERVAGRTEAADVELLYGRGVTPWWDVVVGLRSELAPDDTLHYAAVGVQGLAPMKFHVEATAYVGEGGRIAARLEVEYELLLTNRLVLQPTAELTAFGEDDAARERGAGLATAEFGLRLRYEFTRRFAPYLGLVHERSIGDTADLRRAAGEPAHDTRVVIGLRTWF